MRVHVEVAGKAHIEDVPANCFFWIVSVKNNRDQFAIMFDFWLR